MPLPHVSRPEHPNQADRTPWISAGAMTVALGHWILDGAGTATLALGGRIRDGIVRGHRRREAIRELSTLDDRMLRDIGLRRVDIPFVVDQVLDESLPPRTVARAEARHEAAPRRPAVVGCG